jgi:hypothetical protein
MVWKPSMLTGVFRVSFHSLQSKFSVTHPSSNRPRLVPFKSFSIYCSLASSNFDSMQFELLTVSLNKFKIIGLLGF